MVRILTTGNLIGITIQPLLIIFRIVIANGFLMYNIKKSEKLTLTKDY
jgi:hypothetical protein